MTDEQPRDAGGLYLQTDQSDELDRQALALYRQKLTYREIAARLEISLGSAYQRVQRMLKPAMIPAAREAVVQIITNLQNERGQLEDLREALLRDFTAGRQIPIDPRDPDSEMVDDPEHRLKVADRLIKIGEQLQKNDESLRRLQGLDQPAQQQVTQEVTYKIVGLDGPPEGG